MVPPTAGLTQPRLGIDVALERLRRSPRSRSAVRDHVLLHPVTLVALIALVVNDHVLKVVMPGALTGKLSDVTGLVVFPLLVLSLAELIRPSASRPRVLALAIGATAVAFFLVKTTDAGGAA